MLQFHGIFTVKKEHFVGWQTFRRLLGSTSTTNTYKLATAG